LAPGRNAWGGESLTNRSRITNGTQLLPHVHEQSAWARLFRDTYAALVAHCGGDGHISDLKRHAAKYAAALDTEITFQLSKVGNAREQDEEPAPHQLALITTLMNAHRREAEALGWERTARDVTPTLQEYIAQKRAQEAREAAEESEAT
jgi:hypothetical protein